MSSTTPSAARLPKRPPSVLKNALKLVFSVGLFLWLLSSGEIQFAAFLELPRNRSFLLLAFLSQAAWFLIAAARLHVLLSAVGISISYLNLLRLFTVGEFFSLFFLGAMGGDLSRILLLGAKTHRKRGRAAMAVVVDKATVFWVLCSLSLLGFVQSSVSLQGFWSFPIVAGLASAVFGWPVFLLLLCRPSPVRERLLMNSYLARHRSVLEDVAEIALSALLKNAALSFVALALIVANFVACAMALGVSHIPLSKYLVVVPLGTLALALPFSIGGLGTGQVAYVYLFKLCGVTEEAFGGNLSTLHIAIWTLFALLGGLLFAFSRISRTANFRSNPASSQ